MVVYVILLKSCFDYPPFSEKEFASRGNSFPVFEIQACTCDFDSPFLILGLGCSVFCDCSSGKSSTSKSRGGFTTV